jgi:hypothetical protein
MGSLKMGRGAALTAAVLGSALAAAPARAGVITFNFTDLDANADTGTPVSNLAVGPITIGNSLGTVSAPVNTTSASSGYTGASGTGNIGNAVRIGALDTSTSSFYSIVFTPDSGFAVSLSDFDFGTRSTATGPQAYVVRTSIDGFAADVTTGTIANNSSWAFKDNSLTTATGAIGTPVEVRLYTYNGAGSAQSGTQNNRLDDISIAVSATSEAPTPEPGSAAILLAGGVMTALRRRTRRA